MSAIIGLLGGMSWQSSIEYEPPSIDRLVARGAAGIIAGCSEIELLIGPGDVTVPYFPTTRMHALAAVEWYLAQPA